MATKTQTTPSAFPRIRFGFRPKSSRARTRHTPDPPENPDDGDWYIPYNGPYELPPSASRSQNRDSWGQLLGSVLTLGNHGNATSPTDRAHERSSGQAAGGRFASTFPTSGAYSSHPYRTSAAPDATGFPGPTTTTSWLRTGRPTQIVTSSTAFAHMDTTGGVGESPAPMRRSPLQTLPQASTANRLNFTNLLSFGGSTRKSRSDSGHSSRRPSVKRSRNGTPTPLDPLQSNRLTGIDAQPPPRAHSLAHVGPSTEHAPRQRSNTLIGTSRAPAPAPTQTFLSRNLNTASQHRDSPLSTHPYAYAYSSPHSEAPRRAPIVSPPLAHSHSLDKGKGVDRSYQYPPPPSYDTLNVAEIPPHLRPTSRISLLKTISAPNLRNLSRSVPTSKPSSSRGKSRWLSPETWCDALLFPRPRFLEHIDGESVGQRNVSIPSPKAHTLAHTGKERTPLGRSWLRGSRSAVDLHAHKTDTSGGPPRAEPMLMARKGSPEGDGRSSFSRPRSFAQDDLALPSPGPSLARVLEMGASLDRERATWRSQAERSFQSSKLTRSLGRSRAQSAGRARAQLKDIGGVGFLATKTLMGNQLVAPVVGTPPSSEGTQTQQTRSGTSHARTLSSGGHSRAGSKGKIAAMRAATSICISGDKMSTEVVRGDVITRFDIGGKGAGIEVQHNVPSSGVGSSPLPAVDNSTVGIALSSPLPSAEEITAVPTRPIHVHDHPYAQKAYSAPRRSHKRSNSDYAGPHPSAVAVTASASALASDVSARHRLPPQAVLHPYATPSAHPFAAPLQPAPAAPPAIPTSAPFPTLPEVPPSSRSRPAPRTRRPLALSDTREPERVIPHAYAAGNRFSSGPLVLADALSYGLQRRTSADSGLGESEGHYDGTHSAAQLLMPFPDLRLATTPEDFRMDFGHGTTFLTLHSRNTVTSSPPATLNPPVFPASISADSRRSAQASSTDELGPGSRASSPLQTPRPFGTIEDLDRYRNLFYYPMTPGMSGTPSDEHHRTFSRETASSSLAGLDASSTTTGSGSGLAALTRHLGNEFGVTGGLTDGGPTRMWWLQHHHGQQRQRSESTDANVVLSSMSDIYSNSDLYTNASDPDATLLPLSMHVQSESSFTARIPQDVESHDASSVLERSEIERVSDELLRVGTVGVSSTPLAMTPALRISFMGDVQHGHSRDSLTLGNYNANRATALSTSTGGATDNDHDHDGGHNNDNDNNGNDNDSDEAVDAEMEVDSALPPLLAPTSSSSTRGSGLLGPQSVPHSAAITDATRSSYMTNNTSTASRISGLSDFPVPPNQTVVSLDRVEVLKSYFGSDDDGAHAQPQPQVPASPEAGPSQPLLPRERSADGERELYE